MLVILSESRVQFQLRGVPLMDYGFQFFFTAAIF